MRRSTPRCEARGEGHSSIRRPRAINLEHQQRLKRPTKSNSPVSSSRLPSKLPLSPYRSDFSSL
eukprot:scaffold11459_cov68-Cyclotella_meneghiniana.AAC.3